VIDDHYYQNYWKPYDFPCRDGLVSLSIEGDDSYPEALTAIAAGWPVEGGLAIVAKARQMYDKSADCTPFGRIQVHYLADEPRYDTIEDLIALVNGDNLETIEGSIDPTTGTIAGYAPSDKVRLAWITLTNPESDYWAAITAMAAGWRNVTVSDKTRMLDKVDIVHELLMLVGQPVDKCG
jgi:hypothetical protein